MIKVQIVGATGYGGLGMIELLHGHPEFRVTSLLAKTDTGHPVSTFFPHLRGFCDMQVEDADASRIGADADVVVFATPDTVAMEHADRLLAGGRAVIDYSGDFRFHSEGEYKRYAERLPRVRPAAHACPQLLEAAAYGIPELFRDSLTGARLVGNPGCFAVAMVLGLAPLLAEAAIDPTSIIVDGKTGISGAGKKPSSVHHFPERNENLTPYRVLGHQHAVEAATALETATGSRVAITFVPHLLPVTRGLLCTMYATLRRPLAVSQVRDLYAERFRSERFIRVLPLGTAPSLKGVIGSNMCDIGMAVDDVAGRVVVMVAIDNLLKGQAGIALQNLNLMFGLPEALGLDRLPVFP